MSVSGKRYKILYIQKPPGGGSLMALFDLIRLLDKNRFEPIVLCYQLNNYTRIFEDAGIKTIYLSAATTTEHDVQRSAKKQKTPIKLFAPLRRFKRLIIDDRHKSKQIAAIIKEQQIDLIHHNNDVNDSRQGILANRKTRLPQVCHYRSLKPYDTDTINKRIDYFLAKNISRHIYISRAVARHFTTNLHIPQHKGVVLRDIVNVDNFTGLQKDGSLKQSFGFAPDEVVLVNIGRISRWKGQHVFIEAIGRLISQYPHLKALVVGPYDKGVGEPAYFEELQQQVVTLGLQQHVVFTGNRNDVAAILGIADIVVHSAIAPEPQGLVIVEALFAGKPVIVSDAGGAAELVVNNQGGLKIPPGSARLLAEAVESLLPNLSRQQPGLQHMFKPAILSEFNPTVQINTIHTIYNQLLQ